jgi:hypothetical protein
MMPPAPGRWHDAQVVLNALEYGMWFAGTAVALKLVVLAWHFEQSPLVMSGWRASGNE